MDVSIFNPFEVDNRDFVVTFHKANDPTEIRTLRGNLFGPDKGAALGSAARTEYLERLSNNDLIKVYDNIDGRWKSFYATKVIHYQLV